MFGALLGKLADINSAVPDLKEPLENTVTYPTSQFDGND